MTALLRVGLTLAVAILLAGASCQPPPVKGQEFPALRDRAVAKVAVVPLGISSRVDAADDGTGNSAEVAATIVAHQITEALAARGVDVVAPSDVGRALAAAGVDLEQIPPVAAARLAAEEFGADAVMTGQLLRWVEREGGAGGTAEPAAVGFEMTLRAAPEGGRLWSGTFDERQKPLGENVLVTSQYPGGGTRWLTAEELARWGAGRLVDAIPLGASRGR